MCRRSLGAVPTGPERVGRTALLSLTAASILCDRCVAKVPRAAARPSLAAGLCLQAIWKSLAPETERGVLSSLSF